MLHGGFIGTLPMCFSCPGAAIGGSGREDGCGHDPGEKPTPERNLIRSVLDNLVGVVLWAGGAVVAGSAAWYLISYRIERRRSLARVQDCFAREPGIPDEERTRLIAEVPHRFKKAEARERAKSRTDRRPSDAEIWRDAWEGLMRSVGEDELVDELSGQ